jgi:hypothetical protein
MQNDCKVCEFPLVVRKEVDSKLQNMPAASVQHWVIQILGVQVSRLTLERHYAHVYMDDGNLV